MATPSSQLSRQTQLFWCPTWGVAWYSPVILLKSFIGARARLIPRPKTRAMDEGDSDASVEEYFVEESDASSASDDEPAGAAPVRVLI